MRIDSTFLLSAVLCLATSIRAETLEGILRANGVPASVVPARDRAQPISSFAVSSEAGPFLLAYYDDDGSGNLSAPLRVIRYDREKKNLSRGDLRASPAEFQGFDDTVFELPDVCLGSAMHIYEKNEFIVIDTHINPSAGCVLILSRDLKLNAALFGWTLGQLDDNIIYEVSMVHFAPIHAGRIAVYNPRLRQHALVYPPASDTVREQFSSSLKRHLPERKFCEQQNLPCDPSVFSAEIGQLTVNQLDHSFTFEVRMSAESFGEEAEHAIAPQTVKYKFRLQRGTWVQSPAE